MGVRFVSVSKDEIVAELEVRDDLCTAPMRVLHGARRWRLPTLRALWRPS
jgi:hypothetical protein